MRVTCWNCCVETGRHVPKYLQIAGQLFRNKFLEMADIFTCTFTICFYFHDLPLLHATISFLYSWWKLQKLSKAVGQSESFEWT